ncbi:MAG: 4Fe-4S dicluster domain-containing protein [Candidatus Ratteibacteria bacterium]
MNTYFIENNKIENFISRWLGVYDVFAPFSRNQHLLYEPLSIENIDDAVIGAVRTIQPLKFFFQPFQERIVPEITNPRKSVIIGVANCDLQGLKILDKVFLDGDYRDPNFIFRRQNTFIVSIDCTQPLSVCFCKSLGLNPYPEGGFDLNLTKIESGFVVDVGSEKGEFLLGDRSFLKDANEPVLEERKKLRENISTKVLQYNEQFHIPNKISKEFRIRFDSRKWEMVWKNCVQCGSCTNVCPSCVCFLLEDVSKNENFVKAKIWDSCLLPGYARMASGVSPRPLLWERYRNRLACKYQYMVDNFGMIGCTGCGRCIAGCPGKIDKRKVLSCIFEDTIFEDICKDVKYESVKYL